MSDNWTLSIDGVTRSLAAWGITKAKLKYISQLVDTLTLETAVATTLDYRAECVLYFGSEIRFRGWVTDRSFNGKGATSRRNYIVSGAGWWFENIVFEQACKILVDIEDYSKGYTSKSSPKIVLFQDDTGTKESALFMAQQINAYAMQRGAPITVGSYDIDQLIPYEQAVNITCGDAIRRCFRWTRDIGAYWDYTVTAPKQYIKRRANLDAVSLDLSAANLVLEVQPKPLDSLQIRGVKLVYIYTVTDSKDNDWNQVAYDRAGSTDEGPGCLVTSWTLSSGESVPSGVANLIYNSLSVLQCQGVVTLGCASGQSGTYRPGKKLNLTNGDDADWASMNAIIQSSEEDLVLGTVRIEYGPATQLSAQDFKDLVESRMASSTTSTAGGSSTTRNSGSGSSSSSISNKTSTPTSPTEEAKAMEVTLCQNGQAVKATVEAKTLKS